MIKSLKALITLGVFALTTGLALAEGKAAGKAAGKYQTIHLQGQAVIQTNTKTGAMRVCIATGFSIHAEVRCAPWTAPAQ